MNLIDSLVLTMAALLSLVMAMAVLAHPPRSRARWFFGLGMLGFAAESLAAYLLLSRPGSPSEQLFRLSLLQILGLLLTIPWGLFLWLGPERMASAPLGARRLGLLLALTLVLTAAGAAVTLPAFDATDLSWSFAGVRLETVGRYGVMLELLATVLILAGFEGWLRTSKGAARWRIKYIVLGIGGIFVARFFLLSQLLLLNLLTRALLTTRAATVIVGCLVAALSLGREQALLLEDLRVSRRLFYRSIVVGLLGLYLLGVGALGWVFARLGHPENIIWGSVALLVSAIALAALLLSEDARWRLRRFIGLHFYRSKYDYREQWVAFTNRLGSLLSVDELGRQLLGAVTEAVGTPAAALYLAEASTGRHHLVSTVWITHAPSRLEADSPLVARLQAKPEPLLINGNQAPALQAALIDVFANGAMAVPLPWQGALIGVMVIGPERTGASYTPQDLEFLATVAQQAAGAIVTAHLSEKVAQAREFEALHRLTTSVAHDIKNSISALSMLSQNALHHFDEPEFQRDAVSTISRTLDRMKALLTKLSATPESASPRPIQLVNLTTLVTEAARILAGQPDVTIRTELTPVQPVPGDAEALLHVLQNVIVNAVDALDGKGTVTVRTYQDDGSAIVSVSDTGRGISDDYLRRSLFTPFRSTRKGGWGIGLSHAQSVVEAHGGTITVQSKEGEGTTFWVKLPAATGIPQELVS